jgi:hypothetical protein
LKFGDIIMAGALGFVIFIVLYAVLPIPTIPTTELWEFTIVPLVSLLVSALIVGIVFAGKIREESRMISIGKLVVMTGVVMMFFTMISYATVNPHYTDRVDQGIQNVTSTSSWTKADWLENEVGALWYNAGIGVLEVLALSFVGLYLGSMRKPSAKTKE